MADPNLNYYASTTGGVSGGSAGGALATKSPIVESLSDTLDVQLKRVQELVNLLDHIANAVHGPTPNVAGQTIEDARPMATIASRIRDLSMLISRAEAAANRIQGGL